MFENLVENATLCSVRMHYNFDSQDLIIKLMPSVEHNIPVAALTKFITMKSMAMGLDLFSLCQIDTTTCKGVSSAKEADGALKPIPARRQRLDWPTIVIECGVSESLAKLRMDASWWLTNSCGEVRIIIVITLTLAAEKLAIEKWKLVPSNESDNKIMSS